MYLGPKIFGHSGFLVFRVQTNKKTFLTYVKSSLVGVLNMKPFTYVA